MQDREQVIERAKQAGVVALVVTGAPHITPKFVQYSLILHQSEWDPAAAFAACRPESSHRL